MKDKEFLELIDQYENMIWQQVHRHHIPNVTDKEDLFQMGLIGLWKAKTNFDESRNFKFSTYAYHNISGWVRRGVQIERESGVSRGDLEKINYYKENPNARVKAEDIHLVVYAEGLLSLDRDAVNSDGAVIPFKDKLCSGTDIEKSVFMKNMFEYSLNQLSDLEKSIILLKYVEGYKNKEIQEMLNISHTHLWSKEKEAKNKIKKYS